MNEKKTIVFCISTLGKGGAERVICNLANYFTTLNYNVKMLVLKKKDVVAYNLHRSIEINYIDNENNKKNNKLYMIKKFNKTIKKLNPDIIVSFLPKPNFLSIVFKYNSRVIISVRNDPKIEYKNLKNKLLMRLLYPKADAVVFQTEDAKLYFSDIKLRETKIIPNSISPLFLEKRQIKKRKNKIVAVGRLEEQKNYEMMIDAFKEFSIKNNNYYLYIYGEGSKRETLEKKIYDLNLLDKIKLYGQVDNIIDEIYDAKAFLMSSNYEGMPNSLMEAMSLGIPCISTNCPCGGPKTLIKDEFNGFLVDLNDSKKMADVLDLLVNDNDLNKKISENSCLSMKEYSPEIINNRWRMIIEGDKND